MGIRIYQNIGGARKVKVWGVGIERSEKKALKILSWNRGTGGLDGACKIVQEDQALTARDNWQKKMLVESSVWGSVGLQAMLK